MSPGRRAMLLMAAFVALWAVVEALAARLLRLYSPYQVVWTRYAVHLAFMGVVWGWREPGSLWRTHRPVYQVARSLLMLGMPASWVIGTQRGVDPATLMSIFWLSPLLILSLATVLLGERARWRVWLATAIGCAGACIAFRPGPLPPGWLLIYPLGMAVTFSLYVVMTRSLRSETTRANLFYTALGVAVSLSPVMPRLWITPPVPDLLVLVGVGIFGFATLFALDRAAAVAPVSVSAPFASLQVAFTFIFAWGLGHGQPGRRTAAGLLLVVGAALYAWVREPGLVVQEPA
jgi:drug/metabolite transporter (DMT)-like permease